MFLQPNRKPKNGKSFLVVVVARISKETQDPRSLDDQQALCVNRVKQEYSGEIEYAIIASQGSGELLDREELQQLKTVIESDTVDLVVVEDLGRICRRNDAIGFCERCEDHGTRLIAINDRLDTDLPGWQDAAHIATWMHERSNRDTSSRIKRSCNNRFDHGQLMESMIYGYIVPAGARNDTEVSKDPSAEPIILEIFRRLEDGATYSEVADWLNSKNVPVGPYCRMPRWNCAMVSRLVHIPLLKGERVRNRLVTRRNHKTGRHHSVKAPAEMLRVRKCPHLAFFDAEYYDHVLRIIDARNAKYRRVRCGEPDMRQGVPRSRTAWPGQHMRCGVCGRLMYWTRCGRSKALFCAGAQNYECWNSLVLNTELFGAKVSERVLAEIRSIPGFDEAVADAVRRHMRNAPEDRIRQMRELEQQLSSARSGLKNILKAIERGIEDESFVTRAKDLQSGISELSYQLRILSEAAAPLAIPDHQQVCEMMSDLFARLNQEDQEAGRIMRRLVPEMYLVPYRCADDEGLECRVHLSVDLVPLLNSPAALDDLANVIRRKLVIDVFDPPQKVRFLESIKGLRSQGKTERQVAATLGIKQPIVQKAMRLARIMADTGLADPYIRLWKVPPSGKSKLKRHMHPRFRFAPLEGFPII